MQPSSGTHDRRPGRETRSSSKSTKCRHKKLQNPSDAPSIMQTGKLLLLLCLAALPLECVGLCEEMHNRTWHDVSGFLEYTLNSITATRFTLHAIPYPGAQTKYINDTTVTIDPVPNAATGEHNLTAFVSTWNATLNGTLITDTHTGECTTLNLGQALGITVGRPGGCVSQYTKDDCDICIAPFTGGRCGWCESRDGVHKLCFNVGSLWALDNTTWTCDHKAGPPPPPPPPEPTGFFKCDVVATASTTVTVLCASAAAVACACVHLCCASGHIRINLINICSCLYNHDAVNITNCCC